MDVHFHKGNSNKNTCMYTLHLSYTNRFYTDTDLIQELCMTLINFTLMKWKRIEYDLEVFFFFKIAFMYAVAPNMLQVQLVVIFLNLFSCETLVNNSLSQLLLNYPGETCHCALHIHSYMFFCIHAWSHIRLHMCWTLNQRLFTKAL